MILLHLAFVLLTPAFAADFPDVAPQLLRSVFKPSDPENLYISEERDPCERVCPDKLEREDFPGVKDGKLTLPARYDMKELDEHDRALLDEGLKAAYRYADINNAAADGYVFQDSFASGMGMHMQNLQRILDKELDPAKPQFLTYTRSRKGQYMLMQIGYLRPRKPSEGYYSLYHAKAAKGHFHPEDWCARIVDGVFRDSVAPCPAGAVHVGPIWMMHVTVNMYGQDGIFSDFFSCANHLSRTGTQYTFFGKPVPGVPAWPKKGSSGGARPREQSMVTGGASAEAHHHAGHCGMMGAMHDATTQ